MLAFVAVTVATGQLVQAQETEEQGTYKLYEKLDAQYDAILEKYGFVTPELTGEQERQLDAELASLDEKYWELDQEYEKLDAQYDAIFEKYGFVTPELTGEQERQLDAKLASLDEQYREIADGFEHYGIPPELEAKFEELDMQYHAILEQFGFSSPELTEQQEAELAQRLVPLDEQYEKISAEMTLNDPSGQLKQKLEAELEELDSKYSKILQEFGIAEPVLTEEQEMELERLLAPLEEQYLILEEEFESDQKPVDDN